MFDRSALKEQIQAFEAVRKKQGPVEIGVFLSILIAAVLVAIFLPECAKGKTAGYVFAATVIAALLGSGWLVDRNTKIAKRRAGLICPLCGAEFGHSEAFHALLYEKCEKCNASI